MIGIVRPPPAAYAVNSPAAVATAHRMTVAAANDTASCGAVSNSKVRSTRVAANAAGRPMTRPAATATASDCIAKRSTARGARYARLDLRLVDSDETAMWITKVQPINGR